MTRVRNWWMVVVMGGLLVGACQKPTVCPVGFKEQARGDAAVICRASDGKALAYYQLHPGTRQKRQSCPFVGGVLEGEFQAWHPGGKLWLTGRYAAGRLAGKWQQWSETGSKVADGEYREGRLITGAPVAMAAICDNVKPE
jgi:hypothetical protein